LLRPGLALALAGGPLYALALAYYALWPTTTTVGYTPEQPVPYSHALHAGDMGIDCRYCHNTVDRTAAAAVPPTDTCMNCHELVRNGSEKLIPVLQSHATGMPVQWKRVHDLPDFVYFDHRPHRRAGVRCQECHGTVASMEHVSQVQDLSMGWCIDCHRTSPERYAVDADTPAAASIDCSTCHF